MWGAKGLSARSEWSQVQPCWWTRFRCPFKPANTENPVRSWDEVPSSFQEAFRRVGISLSAEAIAGVRGRSKREAIADLPSEHQVGSAEVEARVDEVPRGRPAPDLIFSAMNRAGIEDARSVVVAGDTTSDLDAAATARVGWIVGVLSGAHSRAQLEGYPHSAILESVEALPHWLEEVGGLKGRGSAPIKGIGGQGELHIG